MSAAKEKIFPGKIVAWLAVLFILVAALAAPVASAKTPCATQNRAGENSVAAVQSRLAQSPRTADPQWENSIGRYDLALDDTLAAETTTNTVGALEDWTNGTSAADRLAARDAAADAAENVAGKGAVADANFAQSSIRANEAFSKEGIAKYSELAGRPINNVNDLAAAIKDGTIKPSQLPVDYVVQPDGTKLILNSRTSVALDRAGIPKSEWVGTNQTGVPVPGMKGTTFDDLARAQLRNSKLPPTGSPDMPRGGN